jgi:uncharacterized protein YrzB (UPF0473 family)
MTHPAYADVIPKYINMEDNMASKDRKDKLEEAAARDVSETTEYEEDMDEYSNLIELTDEDGVTTVFEYLTTVPYEGNEYVVLMVVPDEEDFDAAEEDDEGEVVILKIEQDENGEDMYVTCEDEEISQAVFDLFMEQLDEDQD